MFSSALKSFTSNISSNYTIAPQPSSTAGPWKIFDAKRKQTGKAASVFVFDRKSLEPTGGSLGGRGNAASLKRVHEEIVERLKREASSLARLRHPSILELAEPVEETRNGGLMFATEPVTASLASLLEDKDGQERSGGVGGRGSRYMVEEQDGTRRRRELEIDELEIQKGLLQLGKGLEFLHESAGLVHANLTPEAVMVNAKGDWKIAGLGFCGPHENTTAATSLTPISLFEVLNHDPRLPRTVQLNLDWTSPDFVLDNNLNPSADLFSLGVLILALYNLPHTSPLSTGGSLSSYKRLFSSSSTIPTQSNNFLLQPSRQVPPRLASELLPRLLTRRPVQRLSAREFQEASYFDNILVSTIRFLDELPAKTPTEKAQFMRGLPKIMPQFPKTVLEKKVLPALLEEMIDRELLAPILTNVFAMVKAMPAGKRAFTERVVPRLREIFIVKSAAPAASQAAERDAGREAGLMVLLENMQTAAENCPGKEFREDILPILILALESPTHGIVDVALGTLSHVLPVLDFSTIKNDLFPVIATCFSRTSSLAIKIRGLEAFNVLCGGSPTASDDSTEDDLNGIGVPDKKKTSSTSSSAILDKFTVQEKIVPLLKGIRTKEPGVMMAALKVFRQVGEVADSDFLAMEILPVLWAFSLGPLLNLQQFQAFMSLIKSLSGRIEREQERKLRGLGGSNSGVSASTRSKQSGIASSATGNALTNGEETDFETLVSGRKAPGQANGDLMNEWGAANAAPTSVSSNSTTSRPQQQTSGAPSFSWQTPAATPQAQISQTPQVQSMSSLRSQQSSSLGAMRTIMPDQTLGSMTTLTPSSPWSQPLQPSASSTGATNMPMRPVQQQSLNGTGSSINWSNAANNTASAWASQRPVQQQPSFGLPPPPISPQGLGQTSTGAMGGMGGFKPPVTGAGTGAGGQRTGGLDKYESLL